jgi:multiple sugar transport system substrate-binding protein
MPRLVAMLFASILLLAPIGVRAADLVVWWDRGFYEQEDDAVAEIIAAFEQKTGKQVELIQHMYEDTHSKVEAALEAGKPPDFLYPLLSVRWIDQWAYEDRLAELDATLGSLLELFDADAVEASTLVNGSTGRRGLFALPMGRSSNHVHVWKSLLQRAGFTLADIPKEWSAFWSFWCDQVQPAVRRATGREDIWGVGLPMSEAPDTQDQLTQFQLAYRSPWLDEDGRLQVDDPVVRKGMVKALDAYLTIWRKDCTPPASLSWSNVDNNDAFLTRRVVMTFNTTLSIPAALRTGRPEDYYESAVTIEWPDGADGQPLVVVGFFSRAGVLKDGAHRPLAEDFVRFLVEDGWLAHWLNFAGDRYLPPMRKLVEQPFWLDSSDPHRMHAAVQILTRPHHMASAVRDKEWRSSRIWGENVWGKAVHRVAAEGISPEQAVDEAIARIKQILAE